MRKRIAARERMLDHAEKLEAERERLGVELRRLTGENRQLRAKLSVAEAAIEAEALARAEDQGRT